MPPDLSKLSTEDLMALRERRLEDVSTEGLQALRGDASEKTTPALREATVADKIVANPLTRFALGASAPIRGAFELLPDALGGEDWRKNNAYIREMVETGKRSQPDVVRGTGAVSEFGGEVLSPAFLGAAKVMGAPKSGAALMRQGATLGTLAGLTAPTGTTGQDRLEQGAFGALAGGVLAPVAGAVTQWGGRAVAPFFSNSAQERAAARVANRASGDLKGQVSKALQGASPDQTAPQAALNAGSSEFSALGELAAARYPSKSGDVLRDQVANRLATIKGVTPDLDAAIAARKAASTPHYEISDQTLIPFDYKLKAIVDRVPRSALNTAMRNARTEGDDFLIGTFGPKFGQVPEISGKNLHRLKIALSDIAGANPATSNVKKSEIAAATNLLDDLVPAIEQRIPAYGQARSEFARLSPEVNQANVLTEMTNRLKDPALGEKAGAFLNVLGAGEKALLKKSTGQARYQNGDLTKVLSKDQMDAVNKIADELRANALLRDRASEGMHGASKALHTSDTGGLRAPALISQGTAVTNWLLQMLEGQGGERAARKLGELMLPGNAPKLGALMQMQASNPNRVTNTITRAAPAPIQEYLMNERGVSWDELNQQFGQPQ